jgi:hypothetical protein
MSRSSRIWCFRTELANLRQGRQVTSGMMPGIVIEDEDVHEASADQRALVRLVRSTKTELEKRIADIGCMKPDEIEQFLNCIDKLIELHVDALTMDDYVESTRDYLQRATWTK